MPEPTSQPTRHPIAFRLVAIGCAAFVILTLIAMFLYAGGSRFNPGRTHYDFFDNFFSDLGGTRTPSGKKNLVPMVLFATAMVCAASSVALFFWAIQHFHRERRLARRLSRMTALMGLLIGLGFLGVAATPWNVALHAHVVVVHATFRLMFFTVLLATILLWREKTMPRRFAAVFAGLSVLVLTYSILLAYGPRVRSPAGRKVQVIGQKVVVYASIGAIGLQTLSADRLIRQRAAQRSDREG